MGKRTLNGIEFEEPDFRCADCGNTTLAYRYVSNNNSIQARCEDCGKWWGNIRHDKRKHEQIRKDKIAEWLKEKKNDYKDKAD